MTIEDGIHKVEKTEAITSIPDRMAAYVQGACFHVDKGELQKGDKVVIEDGMVEAKIEPLPEAEEAEEA